MKEIVERLHENRQIEIAKSILESNGYKISKRSLKESSEDYSDSLAGYKVVGTREVGNYEIQTCTFNDLEGYGIQVIDMDGNPLETNREIDDLTFDKLYKTRGEARRVVDKIAHILSNEKGKASVISSLDYDNMSDYEESKNFMEENNGPDAWEEFGMEEVWQTAASILHTKVGSLVSLLNGNGEFYSPKLDISDNFKSTGQTRLFKATVAGAPCVYAKDSAGFAFILIDKKYTR